MASGTIPKPYDGYQEYTLTKASDATNWTFSRGGLRVVGKTAYLQFVGAVAAAEGTGYVTVINLPVAPPYAVEGRFTSGVYAADFNYQITTGGAFQIARTPQLSSSSNIRINVSFPIA